MNGRTFSDEPSAAMSLGIWRYWPLRFVLFFIVLIAAYAGCQFLPIVVGAYLKAFVPAQILSVVFAVLGAAILITIYRLLVRWTERRNASELGVDGMLSNFAVGTIIGIALFCAVVATIWVFHAATFGGFNASNAAVNAAAGSLLAGVGEEIAFRGGVYRLLEEGFGTLVAIILSGALFGLIHATNPGATLASSAAIALEAGILLAAAYAMTRSLWLPIGLHFGWNFTEGGIFSAAVSGGKAHGIINTGFEGPASLTGGAFGPEASVPAVGICLAVALVMLVIAARRGEWKPLTFRLTQS